LVPFKGLLAGLKLSPAEAELKPNAPQQSKFASQMPPGSLQQFLPSPVLIEEISLITAE